MALARESGKEQKSNSHNYGYNGINAKILIDNNHIFLSKWSGEKPQIASRIASVILATEMVT